MKTNQKIMTIVAVIALVAILGVCLVACNAESYTKKLEKKDYVVTAYQADKDEEGLIEWGVVGNKGLDVVTVIKYKSTDDAKKAEQDLKDASSAAGIFGGLVAEEVYRTGKIVIFGSKEGVKAAK